MRLLIILASFGFILGLAQPANAQILIVDNSRVENEAAAYKDFNLQTATIRDNILKLRQYFARGGTLEQAAAQLEQQKPVIGNDEFEKQRSELEARAQNLQQQLQIQELFFDQLRQKALRQVERARQPVIRDIIKARGAQIVIPKRAVLGHASGIDVTTEFIEQLDEKLAQVDLPELTQSQQSQSSSEPASDDSGIEEID